MDTGGGAPNSLSAEDLLQQLSRDLGLPDFLEEDASSPFSDHHLMAGDPFSVEGRANGHAVPMVRGTINQSSLNKSSSCLTEYSHSVGRYLVDLAFVDKLVKYSAGTQEFSILC